MHREVYGIGAQWRCTGEVHSSGAKLRNLKRHILKVHNRGVEWIFIIAVHSGGTD